MLGVKKLNHNAKSPKFFNQTKNIAIVVVVVVVSRIEKNEKKDVHSREKKIRKIMVKDLL